MNDAIALSLSVLVLIAAMIVRPARARCRRGFGVAGAFVDGSFRCRLELDERDTTTPELYLEGRIYCDRGRAFTRDGYSVACTR